MMELKKSKHANLEDKKNLFFLFGLTLALGATLLAFEWKANPGKAESLGSMQSQEVEEEIIPITREKEITPPPPPPPPQVIEVLNIVDDNVDIDDELQIEDSEADDETVIDIKPVLKKVDEEVQEDQIFFIVEEPAEFPGGVKALYSYINSHVNYPLIAQENGIQGKVFVKFVVNEKGKVSNVEILRGVDSALDNEALRVITKLPDFKPGKQRGMPVKVYYNAVINFQLK